MNSSMSAIGPLPGSITTLSPEEREQVITEVAGTIRSIESMIAYPIPRSQWRQKRIDDLEAGIKRRMVETLIIPYEWVSEYMELIREATS